MHTIQQRSESDTRQAFWNEEYAYLISVGHSHDEATDLADEALIAELGI